MSFLDRPLSFETRDTTHISSLKVFRIFIELLRAKVKLRKKKKKMCDDFWISLKRSIHCKPNSSEVHEPEATNQHRIPQKNSNSKDCFQRSGSLIKSLRNSDILSPLTHKVVFDVSPCCSPRPSRKGVKSPRESRRPTTTTTSNKTHHHVNCNECNISSSNSRLLMQTDYTYNNNCSTLVCLKCGEKLKFVDAVEEHHVSQLSVIELDEEDPTRQIIETICRTTSSTNSQTKKTGQTESVLKVQSTPRTFARFEEYREMIKNNAEKSDNKKQPRCLVDGNELLRFHGTTLTCSMGINGSSSSSSSGLCTSKDCCVCQILRHGSFTINQFHGSFGVLTNSTCDKAFESIGSLDYEYQRKSVMVCRVIAGRVRFSSGEEIEESEISGFDSLAEKRNGDSEIEKFYVLDPRAILPCFVLIFKP